MKYYHSSPSENMKLTATSSSSLVVGRIPHQYVAGRVQRNGVGSVLTTSSQRSQQRKLHLHRDCCRLEFRLYIHTRQSEQQDHSLRLRRKLLPKIKTILKNSSESITAPVYSLLDKVPKDPIQSQSLLLDGPRGQLDTGAKVSCTNHILHHYGPFTERLEEWFYLIYEYHPLPSLVY